jgi:hypothetical protein
MRSESGAREDQRREMRAISKEVPAGALHLRARALPQDPEQILRLGRVVVCVEIACSLGLLSDWSIEDTAQLLD